MKYPYAQVVLTIFELAFVPLLTANTVKPDPVVLTFSLEAGDLRMELGFVREVQLETEGDSYAIKVIFETEGAKHYNGFSFQFRNLPTDLYICKEKITAYSQMPYLRDDSFYLPIVKSREKAENIMDTIFYGDNCGNYLHQ